MAKGRVDLPTFVSKLLSEQHGNVLRESVRVLAQALMEAEVTIGADPYERYGRAGGVSQPEPGRAPGIRGWRR